MMLTLLRLRLKLLHRMAFKDGMKKADPCLLEPIMKVEVETPEEYMGDVMGDFNSRRGRILGMDGKGGILKLFMAEVPLSRNVWLCNAIAFYD